MTRFPPARVPRKRLALALSVGAALIAGGCSSSCDDESPLGGSARPGSRAPEEVVATGPDESGGPGADGLIDVAPGEALVSYENGRVAMVSNRYPRMGLLGKLSRAVGFETSRSDDDARSANVTLRLADASVEEAIAAALTGIEFQIHYAYDDEAERTVLTRVSLGGDRGRLARRGGRDRSPRSGKLGRAGREAPRQTARERREDVERQRELEEARGDEIDLGLASGDPDTRSEAVGRLRPEGSELETLKDLLVNDASPEVRRTAAERLEIAGGGTAITALVSALDDPDPSVVLAAIDALEFTADAEHIPMILASGADHHSDPEVREAFLEMIEFLE